MSHIRLISAVGAALVAVSAGTALAQFRAPPPPTPYIPPPPVYRAPPPPVVRTTPPPATVRIPVPKTQTKSAAPAKPAPKPQPTYVYVPTTQPDAAAKKAPATTPKAATAPANCAAAEQLTTRKANGEAVSDAQVSRAQAACRRKAKA